MKIFSIMVVVLLICSTSYSEFGYITEKSTGHIISYYDLTSTPQETNDYTFTPCLEENKPDLYEAPVIKDFNLDELDAWLLTEPTIQQYASFFPIIARASEKNTPEGYSLMVSVAQSSSYNIPEEIIAGVMNKLEELGANIGD